MEKFRWCFIGTGKLGHQVAGQLLASGRHEIVSCYTRNMDNAKAFAEEFHCKAYGSAEEAILQMNLLDHDFFVFRNAQTNEVNVVYKRKGNTYGLIEPEN